jgi:hypothetical protein
MPAATTSHHSWLMAARWLADQLDATADFGASMEVQTPPSPTKPAALPAAVRVRASHICPVRVALGTHASTCRGARWEGQVVFVFDLALITVEKAVDVCAKPLPGRARQASRPGSAPREGSSLGRGKGAHWALGRGPWEGSSLTHCRAHWAVWGAVSPVNLHTPAPSTDHTCGLRLWRVAGVI